MELRLRAKILFLVMAACLVFSVAFAGTIAAAGHDHDCTGADCLVCLQIIAAENFMETLKQACAVLLVAACFAFLMPVSFKIKKSDFVCSPVSLKVRFNS